MHAVLKVLAFLLSSALLIEWYVRRRKWLIQEASKEKHKLHEKQKELEEQKLRTQKEHAKSVITQITLLKDSVIGLSSEVKHARLVQVQQDKDIAILNKIVADLQGAIKTLSEHIRDLLGSSVDSNEARTIIRTKKGKTQL